MRRRFPLLLAVAGLLLVWAGQAIPQAPPSRHAPGRGMLLVAAEGMADPRFRETVILLVDYGAGGAAGVVLNRPTPLVLEEVLPGMEELSGRRDPIFWGGPVAPRTLLVLLQSARPPRESEPVAGGVHLTGLPQIRDRLGPGAKAPERFRVFAGYAGWSIGQLAGEIARGDWYVEPFDAAAVLGEDPAGLWRRLRERMQEIWI